MSQGTDQLGTITSGNAASDNATSAEDADLEALLFEGEEEGEDEKKPTAKRRLRVGDQEIEEDEVVAGYMRQRDYTAKTQSLADQRREMEAARQQIMSERGQRANALDVLIGELHQELLGIDQTKLNGLLETDPKAYLRAKEYIEGKTSRIQRAIQHRLALQQQTQQEQARQVAEYAQAEQTKLAEKLPEWRDPKRATSEAREIESYLRREGYQDSELNDLLDHRIVIVARKAMLYDKLLAARGQKSTDKPPVGAIRPGASSGDGQKTVAQKRAAERYRANPNSIDALAALVAAS